MALVCKCVQKQQKHTFFMLAIVIFIFSIDGYLIHETSKHLLVHLHIYRIFVRLSSFPFRFYFSFHFFGFISFPLERFIPNTFHFLYISCWFCFSDNIRSIYFLSSISSTSCTQSLLLLLFNLIESTGNRLLKPAQPYFRIKYKFVNE